MNQIQTKSLHGSDAKIFTFINHGHFHSILRKEQNRCRLQDNKYCIYLCINIYNIYDIDTWLTCKVKKCYIYYLPLELNIHKNLTKLHVYFSSSSDVRMENSQNNKNIFKSSFSTSSFNCSSVPSPSTSSCPLNSSYLSPRTPSGGADTLR